jgi:hypothetical protein
MIAVDSAEYKALSPIERLLNMPKMARRPGKLPAIERKKAAFHSVHFKVTRAEDARIRAFKDERRLALDRVGEPAPLESEKLIDMLPRYVTDHLLYPQADRLYRSVRLYECEFNRLEQIAREMGWKTAMTMRTLVLAVVDFEEGRR